MGVWYTEFPFVSSSILFLILQLARIQPAKPTLIGQIGGSISAGCSGVWQIILCLVVNSINGRFNSSPFPFLQQLQVLFENPLLVHLICLRACFLCRISSFPFQLCFVSYWRAEHFVSSKFGWVVATVMGREVSFWLLERAITCRFFLCFLVSLCFLSRDWEASGHGEIGWVLNIRLCFEWWFAGQE